jgi:NADPH2:quinone reductase
MIVKNIGIRFFIVYNLSPTARAAAIADLTAMLRKGLLTHNIAARLPLDEIAAAHELVEQGRVIGNVVVQIPRV